MRRWSRDEMGVGNAQRLLAHGVANDLGAELFQRLDEPLERSAQNGTGRRFHARQAGIDALDQSIGPTCADLEDEFELVVGSHQSIGGIAGGTI